ncbi:phage tail protein [Devosia nitrariae]|uniref:Phage tail collar domain-containing protein n=1 Tax=Devosia nitrariae TaxID=2071872 RepID=A0ABQ5W108_9HYPH|nr:phage tail protein [Devosia nitrariae]GLQ53747.1 hypothetical protein GCM10010862_10060 [Devosia nitrariae]
MPTDANGTYTLPPSYFVQNGDPIQPVQHNPPLEDLQQAQTDRVMRDGRAPMTGDLNMDGHRVVGLADGVAPGDAATVQQMQQAVPAGAVMAFARNTAPTGWLACRGQAVNRTTYAALFAAIGTTFGAGDGSTTFGLPQMRGEFIRGWNETGSGIDASRAFGSTQTDENKQHTHTASTSSAGSHDHTGSALSAGAHTHTASTGSAGTHDHSGTASSAGAHSHKIATGGSTSGSFDYGENLDNSQGTTSGGRPYQADVSNAGAHIHSLSINDAGAHTHSVTVNSGGAHTHSLSINDAGAHTHTVTVQNEGSEARPDNVALLYCIKT